MPRKNKAVRMARQKANEANLQFCDELEIAKSKNVVSQNQRIERRYSISTKSKPKSNKTPAPKLQFPVEDPMEGSSKSCPDPTSKPERSVASATEEDTVTLRREITHLKELVSSMQSNTDANSADSDSEMEEQYTETIDIQKHETESVSENSKVLSSASQKRSITRRLSFSNKNSKRSKETSAPALRLPVADPPKEGSSKACPAESPEHSVTPADQEELIILGRDITVTTPSKSSSASEESEIEEELDKTKETHSAPKPPKEQDTLKQQNEQLQDKITKLEELNMKLQEKLLNTDGKVTFTEVLGFPDRRQLLRISQQADTSDYLFVKELVFNLWPNGVGTATVTGRKSNNPVGSSKKKTANHDDKPPGQLCPKKIEYLKERLYERRLLLQDSLGRASKTAGRINRIVTRVIANNPDLRKH